MTPAFHRLQDVAPRFGPANRYVVMDEPADSATIELLAHTEFVAFRELYPAMASIRVYIFSSDSLATAGWGEWVAMMSQDQIIHRIPTFEFSAEQFAQAWRSGTP